MAGNDAFYMQSMREVFHILNTTREGLSKEEAEKRILKYGRNQLTSLVSTPKWLKFLFQFKDVFMVILIIAASMSFTIGNVRDGIIMLIIVLINGIIGYFQEHKAEKIMESLKRLVQSPAKVVRNDELMEIAQENVVPGDIVHIEEGDKVPADVRLIEAFNLRTNDFSLTGESMPQDKDTSTIKKACPLPDRDNMAYLGTTVASGNGKGIVVATGMHTEVGKIANLAQEEKASKSPLQRELEVIANRMYKMFQYPDFGKASTLAVILLLFVIPMMLINIRRFRRQREIG